MGRRETGRAVAALLAEAGIDPSGLAVAPLTATDGRVNRLVQVRTAAGAWVAKEYLWPWPSEARPNRPLVERDAGAIAAATGMTVGRVDACWEGATPWALLQFVSGSVLGADDATWDRADLEALGSSVRRFHDEGMIPPAAATPTWEGWVEHMLTMVLGLLGTSAAASRLAASAERVASIPTTLVHHDLHPWNVLVDSSGRTAVIDWEMAQAGDPLWDVATFGGLWRRTLSRAPLERFLRGYGDLDSCRLAELAGWVALWMAGEAAAGDTTGEVAARAGCAVAEQLESVDVATAARRTIPWVRALEH